VAIDWNTIDFENCILARFALCVSALQLSSFLIGELQTNLMLDNSAGTCEGGTAHTKNIAQNTHQFEAGIGLQGRTQVMVEFLETTHLNDPMITPISRPSSSSSSQKDHLQV
jgi:hypothetical protein